jgi:hypothetical protein
MGMTVHSGVGVRSDYRCAACGYGVVAIDLPPTCPMCGGSTWDHAEWRPFSLLAPELFSAEPALLGAEQPRPAA